MKPTNEQVKIIETARTGVNLAISAFAGAAKTTTCRMVAEQITRPSLYIAFNKAIADEAKTKFPAHVDCRTLHSIAYETIVLGNKNYQKRLKGSLDSREIVKFLDTDLVGKDYKTRLKVVRNVRKVITEFCQSAERDISGIAEQVFKAEIVNELRLKIGYDNISWEFVEEQVEELAPLVTKVWDALVDRNGTMTLSHDIYLKLYHLGNPTIHNKFKTIYLDEAQDSNDLTLDIVFRCADRGAQVILVGDTFQCLPEGTMIDGKPIETISIGDTVTSFVNGTKVFGLVEKTYSKEVDTTVVKATTASGRTITSTLNHTHFIDFKLDKHGYLVYLMYKEGFGYRIGCTQQFYQRCSAETADKVWILREFGDDMLTARIFEQVTSFKYGIPTLVFNPRSASEFPKEYFEQVFRSLDTETSARSLLVSLCMSLEEPHYIPQAVSKDAVTFTITLCGDSRNVQSPYHRYSCIFSETQAERLRHAYPELTIRDTGKNNNTFRLEGVSSDLDKLYNMFDKVKTIIPNTALKELAKLHSESSLQFCSAFNLKTGMRVLLDTGELDTITSVELVPYKGKVYDLDIHKYHNFSANGIITHNSIYTWRGAINAFDKIPDSFTRLSLTTSFRFHSGIADIANVILKNMGSKEKVIGAAAKTDNYLKEDKAILCRTNAGVLKEVIAAASRGEKVYCTNDFNSFFSALWHALFLKARKEIKFPYAAFSDYEDWDMFEKAALDGLDDEASQCMNYIEHYKNIGDIIKTAKETISKELEPGMLTITTMHKSKGLEYDVVEIVNDFAYSKTEEEYEVMIERVRSTFESSQLGNLLYVAVTRAKQQLILDETVRDIIFGA